MAKDRFVLRRLAFTGPRVETRDLSFVDGLNLVWGASNAGKTFALKSLDFMFGAKDALPTIPELSGYETCWLELDLPISGTSTLSRSLKGGALKLFRRPLAEAMAAPGTPDRKLAFKHAAGSDNLSGFLLGELGVVDKRIVKNADGKTGSFSFRHFAEYVLTHETDMIGENSPVAMTDIVGWTFDRNVFKFLLTGVDDSDVVEVVSAGDQKTANTGKVEILDEMISAATAEFARLFPQDADPATVDLESQEDRLADRIRDYQSSLMRVQGDLDTLRRERRAALASGDAAAAAAQEIVATLERFSLLDSVYRSDIERLVALEEGAAALMAGARRACPTCGADPEHQRTSHGLKHVEITRNAVGAEIRKIRGERNELALTVRSIEVERIGLVRRVDEEKAAIAIMDRRIEAALPVEADSRRTYEDFDAARHRVREGLAVKARLAGLHERRLALASFKAASRDGGSLAVGVDGILGTKFAKAVQAILVEWRFPGDPDVSWNDTRHDVRIHGRERNGNGKGVRALMHAAFKIAVRIHCRDNGLPHPGVVVLDSPLLSYRDPHTSKYGELDADEVEIKKTGLKDHFYRYLLDQSHDTQFIVFENDPPPFDLDPTASVTVFAGPKGDGDRQGLL